MIRQALQKSIRFIDDLIYPQYCESCEIGLSSAEVIFCFECRDSFISCELHNRVSSLSENNHLDFAMALCPFDEDLQLCIHQMKYSGFTKMASFLLDPFSAEIQKQLKVINVEYLVPVPLHRVKLRERGFNQALLLADTISAFSGIPVLNCIIRNKWTVSQTTLNISERKINTEGAFSISTEINCKNLLLIDDVITTGATANACVSELKKSGANWVGVFALGIA